MIRAKNYETVSKFVKVMTKILWPLFFPDTVYIMPYRIAAYLPRSSSTGRPICSSGHHSLSSSANRLGLGLLSVPRHKLSFGSVLLVSYLCIKN